MNRIMNLALRILCLPVIAALAAVCWICMAAVRLAAGILQIISPMFVILGLIQLFCISSVNGIILLAAAFLLSPGGLPTLAVKLLCQIQRLRYAIQERVYGW